MKYKISFRLDWLEMAFVLSSIFFSGVIVSSDMDDEYLYAGLLILPAVSATEEKGQDSSEVIADFSGVPGLGINYDL